jgi:predicted nuclease with TOPRIM domain
MLALQIENERMKIELRSIIDQLTYSVAELQSNKAFLEEALTKIRNEKTTIYEEMMILKEAFRNQIEELTHKIQFLEQEKLSLIYEYDEYKVNCHKIITEY